MTTPKQSITQTTRRFSRLIFAALESPASVDRNDLLAAASAFLDIAQERSRQGVPSSDPTGLTLARGMAFRACDWCVFGRLDDYAALTRAFGAFRMYLQLQTSGVDQHLRG